MLGIPFLFHIRRLTVEYLSVIITIKNEKFHLDITSNSEWVWKQMMKKVTNGCCARWPHPGLLPHGEEATWGEVRGERGRGAEAGMGLGS
jgi:hypothetical protein